MKDKIDLLLESVEKTDSLSDTELDELLEDTVTKDIYNVVSKTAYALTETPEPDIDKEWDMFSKTHFCPRRKKSGRVINYFISRNAAAVVIFVIASFTVIAATIGVKIVTAGTDKRDNYETESTLTSPAGITGTRDSIDIVKKPSVISQTYVIKNESFENIISAIAASYGATVVFDNDSTKDLRLYFNWDKSQPLEEVIAQLNSFERINITSNENTITVH